LSKGGRILGGPLELPGDQKRRSAWCGTLDVDAAAKGVTAGAIKNHRYRLKRVFSLQREILEDGISHIYKSGVLTKNWTRHRAALCKMSDRSRLASSVSAGALT
jgi:hypothetical protein